MPGLIRDHSRTDANVRPLQNNEQRTPPPAANSGDQSRTDANVRAPDERHLERLENENEFLRGQIGAKDKTIEALLERDLAITVSAISATCVVSVVSGVSAVSVVSASPKITR
jgi:hypothetical protein